MTVAIAPGSRCSNTRMNSRGGTKAKCKTFCEKDDKCNSCQAYQDDEKNDKFVWELFVEIIDINTWENDCDYGKDDKDRKQRKKDDWKYYDTSGWNAHYGW
ncbi:hypothetical protein IW261DRAFT_1425354 [Armillaria novae-zelandiae]|uniref:Uncharacterized protein n=1 Tax=Armillaria novae-zelandiae TaxID=153914 RepID=A0AA39NSU4_9AGAR|nr:hypothetical protein IW261DRAFT_1425354 [Armillaria novae-zelandiae]